MCVWEREREWKVRHKNLKSDYVVYEQKNSVVQVLYKSLQNINLKSHY